jgi:hypothetical protein
VTSKTARGKTFHYRPVARNALEDRAKTTLLRRGGGFSSTRETAPAMWLVEALWYVLATGVQTNNRFSLLEQMMGGGLGPPAHRHPLNI